MFSSFKSIIASFVAQLTSHSPDCFTSLFCILICRRCSPGMSIKFHTMNILKHRIFICGAINLFLNNRKIGKIIQGKCGVSGCMVNFAIHTFLLIQQSLKSLQSGLFVFICNSSMFLSYIVFIYYCFHLLVLEGIFVLYFNLLNKHCILIGENFASTKLCIYFCKAGAEI